MEEEKRKSAADEFLFTSCKHRVTGHMSSDKQIRAKKTHIYIKYTCSIYIYIYLYKTVNMFSFFLDPKMWKIECNDQRLCFSPDSFWQLIKIRDTSKCGEDFFLKADRAHMKNKTSVNSNWSSAPPATFPCSCDIKAVSDVRFSRYGNRAGLTGQTSEVNGLFLRTFFETSSWINGSPLQGRESNYTPGEF